MVNDKDEQFAKKLDEVIRDLGGLSNHMADQFEKGILGYLKKAIFNADQELYMAKTRYRAYQDLDKKSGMRREEITINMLSSQLYTLIAAYRLISKSSVPEVNEKVSAGPQTFGKSRKETPTMKRRARKAAKKEEKARPIADILAKKKKAKGGFTDTYDIHGERLKSDREIKAQPTYEQESGRTKRKVVAEPVNSVETGTVQQKRPVGRPRKHLHAHKTKGLVQ